MEKWLDYYEKVISDEEDLMNEVEEMESNSLWIPDIQSKSLKVLPIGTPMEAMIASNQYALEYERTYENATSGPKLVLKHGGEYHNISAIAKGTLLETAKLSGSALGRMPQENLATTLNYGLNVAKGNSLLLLRHDKIMALHSGAEGGYCIMPISELLTISREQMEEKFGTVEFQSGYTSNSFTTATWILPEVQSDLIAKYQAALANAASSVHGINFMPAVRLSASDTARNSAELTPYFQGIDTKGNNITISFGHSISVRHEKRNAVYGLDLFEEEAKQIFAKFDASMETIKEMAETDIYHPENCFIGIINRLNRGQSLIPKKYADEAREEIANYAQNYAYVSFHDIYVSMCRIPTIARESGATEKAVQTMEETIGRVLSLSWEDYDIGGTIAWGNK